MAWEAVNAARKGGGRGKRMRGQNIGGPRGVRARARRGRARQGREQRILAKALRREDRRFNATRLPFASMHSETLYSQASGLRRRLLGRIGAASGIKAVKWERNASVGGR